MPSSKNELDIRLAGMGTDLDPYISKDSSPRLSMRGGMVKQALVMDNATPRRQLTGIESQYASATWKSELDSDAIIVGVVPKFPTNKMGRKEHSINTSTLVIFQNLDSEEGVMLDAVEIKSHHFQHQHFGFVYDQLPTQEELIPGNYLPKGTVFAKSPNVTDDGDWTYGVEANVVFMSLPGVIEDGIIVSEDFAEKHKVTVIGERTAQIGKKMFPINLYGDETRYQPFPHVGQKIRDDGLLFALREYDPMLAPVELCAKSCRIVDADMDKLIFGEAGATVIDIEMLHDLSMACPALPIGMEEQFQYYRHLRQEYYEKVLNICGNFAKKHHGVTYSRELHRIMVEAYADNPKNSPNNMEWVYRTDVLDEWDVKIKYATKQKINIGFKLTELHGG